MLNYSLNVFVAVYDYIQLEIMFLGLNELFHKAVPEVCTICQTQYQCYNSYFKPLIVSLD